MLFRSSTAVGNPCDVATGDKSQLETDYHGPDLRFVRSYHSNTRDGGNKLGVGWMHNYAARLIFSGSTPRGLLRPSGHQDFLQLMGDRYVSLSGAGLQVKQNSTQWLVYLPNGDRETYSAQGRLVEIRRKGGRITTLNYDAQGDLTSVVAPSGQQLSLVYANGRLSSVTDPASNPISFAYDGNGNLSEVTYPGGHSRTYHYEHPTWKNHLTGITDENNQRYSTYNYDSMGRMVSEEHAGGVEGLTVAYTNSNSVVTDAAGATTTYNFAPSSTKTRRVTSVVRQGLTTSYTYMEIGRASCRERV